MTLEKQIAGLIAGVAAAIVIAAPVIADAKDKPVASTQQVVVKYNPEDPNTWDDDKLGKSKMSVIYDCNDQSIWEDDKVRKITISGGSANIKTGKKLEESNTIGLFYAAICAKDGSKCLRRFETGAEYHTLCDGGYNEEGYVSKCEQLCGIRLHGRQCNWNLNGKITHEAMCHYGKCRPKPGICRDDKGE